MHLYSVSICQSYDLFQREAYNPFIYKLYKLDNNGSGVHAIAFAVKGFGVSEIAEHIPLE